MDANLAGQGMKRQGGAVLEVAMSRWQGAKPLQASPNDTKQREMWVETELAATGGDDCGFISRRKIDVGLDFEAS